jgi:orotidine-5'-phosphate decarboxylase
MSSGNFQELVAYNAERHRAVCAGFDPTLSRIPKKFHRASICGTLTGFVNPMVEALADTVGFYKPNLGFYLRFGHEGIQALERIAAHMHEHAPDVIKILDLKTGDIGATNEAYAEFAFDVCGFDAVTAHNYMGYQAMEPWLTREGKGVFVLVRTSNKGAEEFQKMGTCSTTEMGEVRSVNSEGFLFERVAANVADSNMWNQYGNVGMVAGATETSIDDLATIRRIAGDSVVILSPGVGKAQGGDAAAAFAKGSNSDGAGLAVNSSSGITHAHADEKYEGMEPDEAAAAEATNMHDTMEAVRIAA